MLGYGPINIVGHTNDDLCCFFLDDNLWEYVEKESGRDGFMGKSKRLNRVGESCFLGSVV